MTPMSTPGWDDLPEDLTVEVPEADAAEQAAPAIPEPSDDTGYPDDTGHTALSTSHTDPADAWEQALPVPGEDDDDYDYDGTADSAT